MGDREEFWQTMVPWRRKKQPTPVFLLGELDGQYEEEFLGILIKQDCILEWIATPFKPGAPALWEDSVPSEPPGKPITQDRKDYIGCKERKSLNRNLEKTIWTIAFILTFWSAPILYVHTLYLFMPLTL